MACKAFSGAVVAGAILAMVLPAGIGHAAFGQEVLRYGSSDHADVRVLQLKLRDLGYNVGIDGYYGSQTVLAVEAFQRAHGVPATGVVAAMTFDELAKLARATALAPAPSAFGAQLAAIAPKYLGVRYVYGGTDPNYGFDSSGLVYYLSHLLGVDLPRTAREQYAVGTPIPENALEPGDLVFFDTEGGANAVGIYMGNDQFIQVETWGTVVHYTSLSDPYWSESYIGARRFY